MLVSRLTAEETNIVCEIARNLPKPKNIRKYNMSRGSRI